MNYNYHDELKQRIYEYLCDNDWCIAPEDFENKASFCSYMHDSLYESWSVTGFTDGTYTGSRTEAEKNLVGNEDLAKSAMEEFETANIDLEFFDSMPECKDVAIRCYLLDDVLYEIAEEIETEIGFGQHE